MNYRPIGGFDHGPQCDDGDPYSMCDECRAEATHDWED